MTPKEQRAFYEDPYDKYNDTLRRMSLELYSWRTITQQQYDEKLSQARDEFRRVTGCTVAEVAVYLGSGANSLNYAELTASYYLSSALIESLISNFEKYDERVAEHYDKASPLRRGIEGELSELRRIRDSIDDLPPPPRLAYVKFIETAYQTLFAEIELVRG